MSEELDPASRGLDERPVKEVLEMMLAGEKKVLGALGECLPEVERAVTEAAGVIANGGRVFYIGAGTSGRLGVMDAAEVGPTFGSDKFMSIIAGGEAAMCAAVEGAEDDEDAGAKAGAVISSADMALGISASGGAPFVIAALRAAKSAGAKCWLLTSSADRNYDFLDGVIRAATGPEVIAGSTRLKAATAAKLVLNMLSTATMVKLGGVYDGLMVDVRPTNKKLIARAEGIIMEITGKSRAEASGALRASGMRPKAAALMLIKDISPDEARALLDANGGSLRRASGTL